MSNQKAFPITNSVDYNNGMDLRDYFAAKAMQAMPGSGKWGPQTADTLHYDDDYETVTNAALCLAEGAYQMADAMMEVRAR